MSNQFRSLPVFRNWMDGVRAAARNPYLLTDPTQPIGVAGDNQSGPTAEAVRPDGRVECADGPPGAKDGRPERNR